MATGAFIRVGSENVEIDEMTDEQLEQLEQDYPTKGWLWAKFLAKWIRDNIGVCGEEE